MDAIPVDTSDYSDNNALEDLMRAAQQKWVIMFWLALKTGV